MNRPGDWTASMLEAALYYAQTCPVFPCEIRGKRPLSRLAPNGLKSGTQDPQQVHAWWLAYPQANIGLVCGIAFWVLDVDGQEGWQSLEPLMARHGPLPRTVKVRTGGGGLHYYFAAPTGRTIRTSAGSIGRKIDVRGAGGYVVAPHSIHESGRCYAFERGCELWAAPLEQAPAWLVELCDPPAPQRPFINNMPRGDQRGGAYANAAVRRAAERVASAGSGGRNETLNREAYSLARFLVDGSLSAPFLVHELTGAALAAGLDTREIKRTLASALRSWFVPCGETRHG